MSAIDQLEQPPPSMLAALRDFAPFGGAVTLAWITVPIASTIDWTQYAIATGLLLVAVSMRFALVRRTGGGLRWILPSLIFLSALALLRNSRRRDQLGRERLALIPVF